MLLLSDVFVSCSPLVIRPVLAIFWRSIHWITLALKAVQGSILWIELVFQLLRRSAVCVPHVLELFRDLVLLIRREPAVFGCWCSAVFQSSQYFNTPYNID